MDVGHETATSGKNAPKNEYYVHINASVIVRQYNIIYKSTTIMGIVSFDAL